jgi:polyhydroxyalkanoate synthesis regulator phasin
MAEKDDKRPPSRADAVRGAAVQAFQATAGQAGVTRERAQELADELAQAAGRFVGALDELRPASADEIRSLREDLRALETRIAALEGAATTAPGAAAKRGASARKASAGRKAPAKKPAAAKKSAAASKPDTSS